MTRRLIVTAGFVFGLIGLIRPVVVSAQAGGPFPAPFSATGVDRDHDGIDDGIEDQLAARFFPNLHYSRGNDGGCVGPLPIAFPLGKKPVVYRLSYPVTLQDWAVPDYIVITYVLLYDIDCGEGYFGIPSGHAGDNEAFVVVIKYNPVVNDWEFSEITTNPHRKAVVCEDHLISTYHEGDRGEIWTMLHKNSNYPDTGGGAMPTPWCAGDSVEAPFWESPIWTTPTAWHELHNLGESSNPLITDLGTITTDLSPPITPPYWSGINPWTDQFFDAGYIADDVHMDGYRFDNAPPPYPATGWHPTLGPLNCDYELSQASDQLDASGGSGDVDVTVSINCGWRIASSADWLTVSMSNPGYPYALNGLAGAGSARVSYTATANTSAFQRVGTLVIGAQTVTIRQNGVACNYSALPTTQNLTASGGTGSFALGATANDCAWSVSASDSWITITSAQAGSGPGTLAYTVTANASSHPRTGSVGINGMNLEQIVQAGAACNYSASPSTQNLTASGGTGSFALGVTANDCPWTASTTAPWIAITSAQAGSGSATVAYRINVNPSSYPRTGWVGINGNNAEQVVQAGALCSLSVNPATVVFRSGSNVGSLTVTTNPSDCAWSATSSASWLSITGGNGPGNGSIFYGVSANPRKLARVATITVGGQHAAITQRGQVLGDFDGDGISDLTVFRPSLSPGVWYVDRSSTNFNSSQGASYQWGNSADILVPGDYDGDGITDVAVFRPSNGTWYIVYSSTGTAAGFQWGNGLDVPVPGDYDGDGKTDLAVFRPSNGTWYIVYSSTGTTMGYQWGNGSDIPVPGDYDGDGKTDYAVFRPSNGTWYIVYSGTATMVGYQWGNGNDIPVPGDYDGDGKTDYAVFRPSNGTWYIVYSGTGATVGYQWGNGYDIPVPGDYDGDGKTDYAVFRPSNGTWYIVYSGTATTVGYQWGNGSDIPITMAPRP